MPQDVMFILLKSYLSPIKSIFNVEPCGNEHGNIIRKLATPQPGACCRISQKQSQGIPIR